MEDHAQELQTVNRELYRSERDLLSEEGLPGREWFRHVMYATGVYTGFAPELMPGLQQMIKWNAVAEAQAQADVIAAAINRMAGTAEKVSRDLARL